METRRMHRQGTWITARRGARAALLAATLAAGCAGPANEKPPASASAPPRAGASASQAPAQVLLREEVVPGKLAVTVYSHSLVTPDGALHFWTYVSEGLWPLGQREIRFSIKREPGDAEGAFDRELFKLYGLIYELAQQGQLVDVHGRSLLAGPPLLGRDDFHCIIYGPPQPVEGITATAPFLTAVIVTTEEEEVGGKAGYARILARLGAEARFYPTPFWTDRKRASVARPGEVDKTLITRTSRQHLRGVSVRLERKGGLANVSKTESFFLPGDRIVLGVLPRGEGGLKEAAAAKGNEDGLVMLLEMDPRAGTGLFWYPGQTTASAIASPAAGSERLTGNFLILTGKKEANEAGVAEDGFVMIFPDATWKRIREALRSGNEITIPGQGEMPAFAVEHVPTTYENPIDGKRYEAEGGWDTARPQGDGTAPKRSGQVDATVVLLTSEQEIEQRTTVDDAAAVIKQIITIVEAQVGTSKGPGSDLLVECELLPGKKKKFEMAQRPDVDQPFAQAIYEKLEKIVVPDVKGPVKFQVVFKIRGGSNPGR
ncbi:hypothetical protein [Polyangium fumosum]|uniref:AgmX/PglI C-terminal domain-containing protein n=1 Tax=Polyangium fumosum TaxID=889272 RepID=A0A4U1ISC8_9BACT|nr:hypothetical protein [Polyangium fumosum]TKC97156.1 hypothetical protein E8A74_44410 [Polyangium fumosum]